MTLVKLSLGCILPGVKVLVTGGTGFVGSHALRELLRDGHEVRLLARTPSKVRQEGVEIVAGDMTDPEAVLRAVTGCEAVVHCAAEIGVSGGSGPLSTANVDGTRLIVTTALEQRLDPIVYTSTITVHLPSDDETITLDTPLAEPLSSYGAQKCAVERFVRELQDDGAPITTLVVGGVYGPESPHLEGSAGALVAALGAGMYAPDSGMGVIDARDLATIIARTLEPGRGPRRYMTTGRYVTWQEWSELLAAAAERDVPYFKTSAEDMIELGRQFDVMRAAGEDVLPLSEEAAIIMCSGRPADDGATLAAFGVPYRPTLDTFRDTVAWLRREGHIA